MPKYEIEVPGQGKFEVESPTELTDYQAYQAVLDQIRATPPQKKGLGAAFQLGGRQLFSSLRTGVESLLPGDTAAANAAIEGVTRQEKLGEMYETPASLEKVKEAYRQKGLLSAAGEVISQVPGAIAQQVPQIGAMIAGAKVGSVAGPWGAVIGAAAVPLAQFFGSNLERQAAEQMRRGDPVDVDRGAAALAAAPQAALDLVQQRLVFGSKLFSTALGIPEKELLKKNAAQVEKLAQEKLLPTLAKGTAKGAAAEIPTEIGQQILERAQAGLALTSPDALAEYGETAYQVGLLGPLGAVGRISEKGAARRQLEAQANVPPAPTPVAPPVQPELPLEGGEGIASPLSAAPQAPLPDEAQINEMRGQYDTLSREIERLGAQFEETQDPAKKQELLAEGQRLDFARREVLGKLEALKPEPTVVPEQQLALDFEQPEQQVDLSYYQPKTRLAEPTVLGAEPAAAPDTSALRLDALRRMKAAGELLTPAEEFQLRELEKAEQAKPAPQFEIPTEVGTGARPTSYIVDDAAIDTFGLSKKATKLKDSLRGLDLKKPEDLEKFNDLVEKHERKPGAKIDMEAVDAFKQSMPESVPAREVPEAAGLPAREYTPRQRYQQAREAFFAFGQEAAPLSPRDRRILEQQAYEAEDGTTIPDVGARASEPGVSVPSGELQPAGGTPAPTVTGLASAEPTTGRVTPREEDIGTTRAPAVSPFEQLIRQVTEGKPDLKEKKAKPKKRGFGEIDRPAPTRKGTAYIQGELQGKSTIDLADRITQGDLKGALEDIASSKQYTPLDNLVAKRLLQSKTLPKVEVVPAGSIPAPAQYDPNTDTIQITEGNIDSHTVLHETVHGFLHVMIRTSEAREARGLGGNPKLKNLKDVYNHVLEKRPDLLAKYGMKDLSEFASEAMSNPDFQNDLRNTPYKRTNVFTEFARAVLRAIGINVDKSGIADIDSLAAAMMSVESALSTGRQMQEGVQAGVRQQVEPEIAQVQRTPQGAQAEQLMGQFGGPAPKENLKFIERQKAKFDKAREDWEANYDQNQSWVAATFGKLQNIASFDQAFNNRLYNHFMALKKKGDMTMDEAKQALLRISTSQALHRANLANQIIDKGNYGYDATTNRWFAVDDAQNMTRFEGLITTLATRLGVEPTRAKQIMGAAYEANRLNSMYNDLNTTKAQLARAEKDLLKIKDPKQRGIKSKLIDALKDKEQELEGKVRHKSYAQVQAGMQLYNNNPEIQEGTKLWNTMRERVIKMMVETGVKTQEQAEAWLDEAAYVPFFRDMGEEAAVGPKIMTRGLRESMRDYRMKGSEKEVADVIDNMYKWMQWSIGRSISNKQLQVMADNYMKYLPDEIKEGKASDKTSFVIYRDGVPRYYNVADPAIGQAFMGLEPIFFPAINFMAGPANFLRHAVTRNPIFAAAQLFMDAYSAMFTSGLKNPFGVLKEIASETTATLRGTSDTRRLLQQYGILETHDYAALNEADAIGRRLNLEKPGAWAKLAKSLDKMAAGSDNVIRQGIYNQARKEGLSHAEAMEKAAEVVNFRRMSSNPTIQVMSRIVPFFNAYLQVASVAVKTLSGRGISPQERTEATKVLVATTAKIAALSALYAMVVGDDEDYLKKNRVSRDRSWIIPGTGGLGIPVRLDIFALPKIAGEYGYQIMTDKAYADSKMVKSAIARALKGSLNPPSEGIPQIVRPALGVMMNYDAFQDREIVNATMRRLDPERQYNKNTSEMAKALGAMTGMSPLNIDFLLRGYLGSLATLTALGTNDIINAARGAPPRPERSLNDMIASLPSVGGFMTKEENTAVLSDYYEAARDVNRAVDTLASMKYATPEERAAYREEFKKELGLKGQVQAINKMLVNIKRREQAIREAPESRMTAEQKQIELRKIDEQRARLAGNIAKIRQKLYD